MNDRWAGAACSTQVIAVVGVVAGVDVGVGVAVPGVVVLVMPVSVPVPVFTPVVMPVDVDTGVPATGEMAGVCVFPRHVVEPTCGARTMPVPVMAAISISDILCCCKIFAASRIPPVIREIAPSIIKTGKMRRERADESLPADWKDRVERGVACFSPEISTPCSVRGVIGCL